MKKIKENIEVDEIISVVVKFMSAILKKDELALDKLIKNYDESNTINKYSKLYEKLEQQIRVEKNSSEYFDFLTNVLLDNFLENKSERNMLDRENVMLRMWHNFAEEIYYAEENFENLKANKKLDKIFRLIKENFDIPNNIAFSSDPADWKNVEIFKIFSDLFSMSDYQINLSINGTDRNMAKKYDNNSKNQLNYAFEKFESFFNNDFNPQIRFKMILALANESKYSKNEIINHLFSFNLDKTLNDMIKLEKIKNLDDNHSKYQIVFDMQNEKYLEIKKILYNGVNSIDFMLYDLVDNDSVFNYLKGAEAIDHKEEKNKEKSPKIIFDIENDMVETVFGLVKGFMKDTIKNDLEIIQIKSGTEYIKEEVLPVFRELYLLNENKNTIKNDVKFKM